MFDVSTQKSIRKIEEFTVLPTVEHSEAGNIFSVFKDANCFTLIPFTIQKSM